MWNYEKRLQYPVHISKCDPKAAMFIMSQYGGLYSITLVEKFLPYYIYQINPLDCCHRVYFFSFYIFHCQNRYRQFQRSHFLQLFQKFGNMHCRFVEL